MDKLYGGIEGGGTKFICLAASDPDHIQQQVRIQTTTPDETFDKIVDFFQPYIRSGQIDTVGIGCFGPLDLDPGSKTYGFITDTPKQRWSNEDILGRLQRSLKAKVVIDTDVNAAGLGEFTWGAGQGINSLLYLTVGTGIGGGYIQEGKALHGLSHPEMGHIRIPHDLKRDPFPGACPHHGDCLEGLICGPALEQRFGMRGEAIPEDDHFWELEAEYISMALTNFIYTLIPQRIVLGGGIMKRQILFPLIRRKVAELLNNYASHNGLIGDFEKYIVPPKLGDLSGSLGAIALARAH